MLVLKFKSAVLTLVAAGTVAAGAVGLSGQAPTPPLRGDGPSGEAEVAATREVDLADRIIELALQAKQQAQANKTAEAVQSLSKVEELAKEWANQLQPELARYRRALGDL